MKRLLLFLIIAAALPSSAQVATTLTPGTNCFLINKTKYPFNTVILNVRATDTSLIEMDYSYTNSNNGVLVPVQKRVNYFDGRTGLPFPSYIRIKQFYDSFMVKQ